jgi:formiminotetrahydrofolate cyclodeaminase
MAMQLSEKPLRDLLAAFRSSDPTPGGGSAAALAGAIGAALLTMVAGLGRPRAATEDELSRLAAAGRRTAQISEELGVLVDRDSEAYEAVMAAYKLPKNTDDEKKQRSARIQEALSKAIETPLDVMRRCAAALGQASLVASFGNANASSDVQVALELLGAGLRGAKLNVEINLEGLKDERRSAEIRAEALQLSQQASEAAVAARSRLLND